MDSATPFNEQAGGTGKPRSKVQKTLAMFRKQWLYIGLAIFLAVLNILVGILTMSYLHPKKEPLIFGIVCFGVIIALGHFASLCYLIQRAKDENSDPTMIDAACSLGVILLFAISGLALTIELPKKCFAGKNEDLLKIGQGCCDAITAMAVSSWLAVLIMIVATIIIFVGARTAIELAKLPPPVFPTGAEAPVMRWLDRNDPFITAAEHNRQYP